MEAEILHCSASVYDFRADSKNKKTQNVYPDSRSFAPVDLHFC